MKVVYYAGSDPKAGTQFWAIGIGSLSPRLVEARFQDGMVWTAREPGVALHPLPDAPAPASRPTQRLSQMKSLSRRFKAVMHLMPNTNPTELRLLTTPLDRYDDPTAGLIDGALFGFANATSPDLILTLEVRENDAKIPTWFYGFGRIGGAQTTARFDQTEVWSQPFISGYANAPTYMTRSRLQSMALP